MPKQPMVPADLIRPLLREYLDGYDTERFNRGYKQSSYVSWEIRTDWTTGGNATEILSDTSGVSTKTIAEILNGNRKDISLPLVDRLLCAMDMPMLWQEEPLYTYYWEGNPPPDPTKPVLCHNPYCGKWFEVPRWKGKNSTPTKHQKYCSKACCGNYNAILRGDVRSPKQRESECRKGHAYETYGFIISSTGAKVCKKCRANANKKYRERPEVKARKNAQQARRRKLWREQKRRARAKAKAKRQVRTTRREEGEERAIAGAA